MIGVVVCHVDDDGVLVEAGFLELRENPTDVSVVLRKGVAVGVLAACAGPPRTPSLEWKNTWRRGAVPEEEWLLVLRLAVEETGLDKNTIVVYVTDTQRRLSIHVARRGGTSPFRGDKGTPGREACGPLAVV